MMPRGPLPVPRARRAALLVALAVVVGVSAGVLVAWRDEGSTPQDPLEARALGDLETFAAWLRRSHARGYVGEVGWPARTRGEGEEWNAVAEAWYDAADADRLRVTAWATGTLFDPSYPLAIYVSTGGGLHPGEQARVVERHPSSPGVLRGMDVAGGEFGADAPGFSNESPGTYGASYRYDGPETFRYLARRGLSLVRLPFRWERIQPRLGEALAPGEVARIRRTVAYAHEAGLQVILDLHNFGAYRTPAGDERLGAEIDQSTFADTWRRIALAFRDVPGVIGYDLMNEPAAVQAGDAPTPERSWERLSQAAVTAIRETGDGRIVFVGGYPWSAAGDWPAHHPKPWIADPLGRIRYEAHQYWDTDRSGRYLRSYAEEEALAARGERRATEARSSLRS